MPELPEVEVVRRGLAEHVLGRTVREVEVRHPRAVRRHVEGPADFVGRLADHVVSGVHRRGKYLWLTVKCPVEKRSVEKCSGEQRSVDSVGPLAGECDAVLAHLGMSGQMLIAPEGKPDEKHLRIRFRFADGGPELRFVDQRTFGGLSVHELVEGPGGLVPRPIAHIARDPLEDGYDPEVVIGALRRRHSEIKRALLDQSLVSGVGNIYADEALWRARLHGRRATERLSRKQAGLVLQEARNVMAEALAAGGTSFDALYVNVNGQSGYFSRLLAVYGQDGEPCQRCGTAIRRESFMNRSSYFCPRCQAAPRNGVGGRGR